MMASSFFVHGFAVVFVSLGACGSVTSEIPADAWAKSCAPDPVITTIESNNPAFGTVCLHGSWYLQALNGTTTPATAGKPDNTSPVIPMALALDTLDPASMFAIHVSGSGQQNMGTTFAFAQLTVALNTLSATEVGSVDASAYTGVQFFAIINTAASGARLTVANLYTNPAGGLCGGPEAMKGCFDSPGMQLTPSTTWTKYQVPFADLVQLGFGNPSPLGADFPKRAIFNLKWDVGIPTNDPAAPWDLQVDDLTFY